MREALSLWLRGERRGLPAEGRPERALECARARLFTTGSVFGLAFLAVAAGLFNATLFAERSDPRPGRGLPVVEMRTERADILDRNGVILATNLPTSSLYADGRAILDPTEAADRLREVLPELPRDTLIEKLSSKRAFVWLKRNLTPKQQYAVNSLGLPGLDFQREERRVYPQGRWAAHLVGFTNVDNTGIAGVESQFDSDLRRDGTPLQLSIDIRLQYALRTELARAMETFSAIGGAGLVLDVTTAEVLGLVSLPDFDPHRPADAPAEARFNRATMGVYEMGSVFKLFNTAIALDSGAATLTSVFDAAKPIRIGRFTIRDYKGQNRPLSVPEVLVYSSNIGSARMALDIGADAQQQYLARFGLTAKAPLELPEIGTPLLPDPWREISVMTVAYGHGISVSPLQLAGGVATVVNGGIRRPVTLLKRDRAPRGEQVISARTSDTMRRLMRLVVTEGSGKKARSPGYLLGGKTGTADKPDAGRYDTNARISSFVTAFPINAPRYVVLVMLDEPKGTKETFGYATAGWTAAPTVGKVVRRIAPILGVDPQDADSPEVQKALYVNFQKRERKLASF